MAVAPPSWVIQQLFDNDGDLLALGKLYFTAGTADGAPLAAYTDASGDTACTNPLILDSAGRCQFWLTENTAYAIVLKDANDVVIETIEQIVVNPQTDRPPASIDLVFELLDESPPTTHQQLFGMVANRALDFPASFLGSTFKIEVNPTAIFVIDIRKNATTYSGGSSVGTLTVQTNGTYAYTGSAFSLASGDTLTGWGPGTVDATAQGFFWTLLAYVTGSNPGDFTTSTDVDAAIEAAIDAAMIGMVAAWPIASVPTGWIMANGVAKSRATYAKLFNKYGTTHGDGDGTTTFDIPDYRGYFLRGYDSTNTVDTDRAALIDTQQDAFQGHFHATTLNTGQDDDGKSALEAHDSDATTTSISTGAPITDGSHGTPRTASETRPKNKAVVWCIYVGVNPA